MCYFLIAAVPGYQHPAEVLSAHPPPFFINKIDATNKEQKLEDKGAYGFKIDLGVGKKMGSKQGRDCGSW